MSDTCWFTLTFRREDLPRFNEMLKNEIWNETFWDEDNGDDNVIHAIIYEANYGWSDNLEKLQKAGLTFTAEHAAGGNYGPMVFACFKGKYAEASSDQEGTPTVTMGENKTISEKEIEWAKKHWNLYHKADKYIWRK